MQLDQSNLATSWISLSGCSRGAAALHCCLLTLPQPGRVAAPEQWLCCKMRSVDVTCV